MQERHASGRRYELGNRMEIRNIDITVKRGFPEEVEVLRPNRGPIGSNAGRFTVHASLEQPWSGNGARRCM